MHVRTTLIWIFGRRDQRDKYRPAEAIKEDMIKMLNEQRRGVMILESQEAPA